MFRLPINLLIRGLALAGFMAVPPLRAVYAPIPEQEQGKDLSVKIRAGVSYDSNLFGAATDEIGSGILTVSPRVDYNASLTDQTFFSGGYGLTLDYFENRPGDKLLDSHDVALRLAHAFSKSTTIDFNNVFMVQRNPESLLAGVPLNADQSFQRNQLDGRFVTPLNAKVGATVKARSVYYDYRNATLGRSIDRLENLYGLAGDYAVLPELKAVAEYRRLDVYYRKLGETKNKRSDFVMGGIDYELAKKLSVSSRAGVEWRERASERSITAPFAEVSGKYDYARESFVLGGYGYSFDETSDTARFTDMQVNRFFVSLQHQLTALIVASASVAYEPGELKGRRGFASIDEKTTRLGAALSYLPTKNWTVSASYDFDRVRSDDPFRSSRRERVGLNATYAF